MKPNEEKNLIYKIVNITNNKEYVGSTINGLNWRKRKHLRELKKQIHHNRHLQNAYNIVGPDKFSFEILEILPSSENLLEREDHWTKLLKPEYNIMREIKSHIGVKRSPETCRKISEALKGRKLSPEHIESMRRGLIGRTLSEEHKKNIGSGQLGRIVTEETRIKIGNAHRGKTINEEVRRNISKTLTGHKVSIDTIEKKSKPILQLDMDGRLIRRWHSLREAIREGKFTPQYMRDCIAGRRETYKNSKWMYEKS